MGFWPISVSNFSWIELAWSILTLGIGLAGAVVVISPKWNFLNDLVKYGKSQSSERSVFHRSIEVPKRWFTHFYILSTIAATIVLFYAFTAYHFDLPPSRNVRFIIRSLAAPNHRVTVTESQVTLTLALLWLHSIRRLFESLFLSVYSHTKMNVLHYAAGWMHYVLVPLTILSEAPGFVTQKQKSLNWNEISVVEIFGVILFVWASYYQHECLSILAAMRRNYLGNITTYAHGIPVTGWFEYVSCPHFLLEILIYVAFGFTLNLHHRSWIYAIGFVTINQILAALITHHWYKEKYKNLYPSERKALVPYIF